MEMNSIHNNLMHIERSPKPYGASSCCSYSFKSFLRLCVILLTSAPLFAGCSIIGRNTGEYCKTRAYVRTDIESFITTRFARNSPVRIAIIPFDVPANLAGSSNELPGLGNQLAWRVQQELLRTELLPIVEIFNREDWPRKKEEFFTGNFGALERAKDAGYDMVLVGRMDSQTRIDTWTVHTKLIEVESGISLWYGTSTAYTTRPDQWEIPATLGWVDRRPDLIFSEAILEELATCIAHDMMNDPEVS
jgi:hypothetical protein